jgi:hypothetical protein
VYIINRYGIKIGIKYMHKIKKALGALDAVEVVMMYDIELPFQQAYSVLYINGRGGIDWNDHSLLIAIWFIDNITGKYEFILTKKGINCLNLYINADRTSTFYKRIPDSYAMIYENVVIRFESEEDAVAFKLRWL